MPDLRFSIERNNGNVHRAAANIIVPKSRAARGSVCNVLLSVVGVQRNLRPRDRQFSRPCLCANVFDENLALKERVIGTALGKTPAIGHPKVNVTYDIFSDYRA